MQPINLSLIDFNPERQYVAVVIGHIATLDTA
jgi:hypothetical protein